MSNFYFNQIKQSVVSNIRTGQVPALIGIAGIGKSSFLEDVAKELQTACFTLAVNQLADRTDLTGARMVLDQNTQKYRQVFFPHETIAKAIDYAENHPSETPILFMDEFNRAPHDVISAILTFITARRIGEIVFPKNLRLVVAGNDSGAVSSIDEASVTRLVTYKVSADIQTFLAVNPDLNEYIKIVLTKHPELLIASKSQAASTSNGNDDEDEYEEMSYDAFADDGGFVQLTRPRTVTNLSNYLNDMGFTLSKTNEELRRIKEYTDIMQADKTLLQFVLEAHAGETPFTAAVYTTIMEEYNKMLQTATMGAPSMQPIVESLTQYKVHDSHLLRLNQATSVQEIEALIADLDQNDPKLKENLFLYLFTTESEAIVTNYPNTNMYIQLATQIPMAVNQAQSSELVKRFHNTNISNNAFKQLKSIMEQNNNVTNDHIAQILYSVGRYTVTVN